LLKPPASIATRLAREELIGAEGGARGNRRR
jgi:hypothetical protein